MLQAASIAALSITVLWLLVSRGEPPPAAYRTVSSADPAVAPGSAAWRVALDAATPASEARAMLADHGLEIVAGPAPDNVYTVAPRGPQPAAIESLRSDPRVRLLEPLDAARVAP